MQSKSSETLRRTPIQRRSQQLVTSVLAAARQLLPAVGFQRLTTVRIAEVAGVGVGSIYEYFKDKRQVILSVFQSEVEKNIVEVANTLDGIAIEANASKQSFDFGPTVEKLFEHFYRIRKLTDQLFQFLPKEVSVPIIMNARIRAADTILRKFSEMGVLSAKDRNKVLFMVNVFMDSFHAMLWHERHGKEYLSRDEILEQLKRLTENLFHSNHSEP